MSAKLRKNASFGVNQGMELLPGNTQSVENSHPEPQISVLKSPPSGHLVNSDRKADYRQLTIGGIELRMVSVFPPVCRPNIVPLS